MTTLHCHDHSKQSIWCPSRTQAANVALLNVIPGTQMPTKDKSIQKFKKIFLLIYQFRNEREAGEKTAPWNAIVLGLLLRKSIIDEGLDYMSLALLARFAKLAGIAEMWFSQITLHWLPPWGKRGHLYTFQTQGFLNPGYVSEREVFKT